MHFDETFNRIPSLYLQNDDVARRQSQTLNIDVLRAQHFQLLDFPLDLIILINIHVHVSLTPVSNSNRRVL